MVSQIINGKEVAAGIRAEVAEEVLKLRAANGRPPKLGVIQVGDNPASSTYVRNKKKACEECGIECEDIHLPKEISQFELISKIVEINLDDTVDGILVQLPLPEHINERTVVDKIDPNKDVDGFTLSLLSMLELIAVLTENFMEMCQRKSRRSGRAIIVQFRWAWVR